VSVLGTVFWAVVLAWLLCCAWITWPRYRRDAARQRPGAR
jgi:hypothetical protein